LRDDRLKTVVGATAAATISLGALTGDEHGIEDDTVAWAPAFDSAPFRYDRRVWAISARG